MKKIVRFTDGREMEYEAWRKADLELAREFSRFARTDSRQIYACAFVLIACSISLGVCARGLIIDDMPWSGLCAAAEGIGMSIIAIFAERSAKNIRLYYLGRRQAIIDRQHEAEMFFNQ
jgi:hypothetical protein